jgi:hypothetical protein
VLGTILGTVLLASLLAIAQVTAVPVWNQASERAHAESLEARVVDLDGAAVRAAAAGTDTAVALPLGMEYPTRGPFHSPNGPEGSATLSAPAPIVVSNARAVDPAVGRYWDGRDHRYPHQSLAVATDYNYLGDDPALVTEGSLTFERRGTVPGARYDVDRFAVVSDRRITLVTLTGDVNASGRVDRTVAVRPISAGGAVVPVTNALAGQPVVLKIPTRLPVSVWNELLADEFTTAGGNVLAPVTREPIGTRTDVHYAVVELQPGRVYEVDASLVGVNADASDGLAPAYVVETAGNRTSVQTGATRTIAVEVRDALNNPVGGALVAASAPEFGPEGATLVGATSGTDRVRTDADGRATFVYTAPPAGNVSREARERFTLTVLDPVDATATPASRTVPFDLCVVDTDIDQGGCSFLPSLSAVAPAGSPPGPDADESDSDESDPDESDPDESDSDESDSDESDPDESDPDESDSDESDSDESDSDDWTHNGATNPKGLSYVAVCSVDGVASDAVTIEVVATKAGGTEATAVRVVGDLDSVVAKYATTQTTFTDADGDGVIVAGSVVAGGTATARPNGDPCPAGQSGFKVEFDGTSYGAPIPVGGAADGGGNGASTAGDDEQAGTGGGNGNGNGNGNGKKDETGGKHSGTGPGNGRGR